VQFIVANGFDVIAAFLITRIQLRSAIPVIMQPHATCHQKIRHEGFYSLTFYEADG
jgi:hypothetical protein